VPTIFEARDGRRTVSVHLNIAEPLLEKARADKVNLSATLTAALVARYGEPWPETATAAGGR
jgi:post-segregation antitoxin (ccd killing protein)